MFPTLCLEHLVQGTLREVVELKDMRWPRSHGLEPENLGCVSPKAARPSRIQESLTYLFCFLNLQINLTAIMLSSITTTMNSQDIPMEQSLIIDRKRMTKNLC